MKFKLTVAVVAMFVVVVVDGACSEMHCDDTANCPYNESCLNNLCVAPSPSLGGGEADSGAAAGEGEGEAPQRCPAVGGISYNRPNPNVMFLVDRSGSMTDIGACATPPCPEKWDQLQALGPYLEQVKSAARLGLTVFPAVDGDVCGVSTEPTVPLTDAANSDQLILGAIQGMQAAGGTPMADALQQVAQTGGLSDPDRDNIVVLLTDGEPNCSTCASNDTSCEQNQAVQAVQTLRARDVPISVDVIGFSDSANAASDTLSAMAVAAGTARQGTPSYFQAETIEDLIARLGEISAGLAPCRFDLDEHPAAANLVVHRDDTLEMACTDADPASCDSGYTYDEASGLVQLRGTSCAAIRDGQCHSVWFEAN